MKAALKIGAMFLLLGAVVYLNRDYYFHEGSTPPPPPISEGSGRVNWTPSNDPLPNGEKGEIKHQDRPDLTKLRRHPFWLVKEVKDDRVYIGRTSSQVISPSENVSLKRTEVEKIVTLSGIYITSKGRIAIIDGEFLREGDTVKGEWTLEKIQQDQIRLKNKDEILIIPVPK